MQIVRRLSKLGMGLTIACVCQAVGQANAGWALPNLDHPEGSVLPASGVNLEGRTPESYVHVLSEALRRETTPRQAGSGQPNPVPESKIVPVAQGVPVAAEAPQRSPLPEYLNPVSNPLQFPTQPQEVKLVGNQPITLEQALELARRNNRTFQVAKLQLENSRFVLQEAQAAQLPTINLQSVLTYQKSASAEFNNRQQELRGTAFFSPNNTTSFPYTASLQLNYNVDVSGAIAARVAAAERQVRLNELEVERQFEDLRLNVSNDYYALQQADEQVRIAEAAVRRAEISLRDTESRQRAGVGTRFEVLQAEVQLANARQDLTRSQSGQSIARRQLAQRLSLPQSLDVSAADPVKVAGEWPLGLEESIILAYKSRAELEQQLVQREIGEQQRRSALAALSPQLTLSANYNVLTILDSNPNPGFANGYSLAATLNWSLFDGGAAQASAAQQTTSIAIAETRFADSRNQVRFQVEQAYANLLSNRANITTSEKALEQAEEALKLARLRFQAGVGTQTDVINSETELTRAEVNRLNAILDYNRALASLKRAVSNISERASEPSRPSS